MYDLLTSQNLNMVGLFADLIGVIFVAISFKNVRREKNQSGYWAGDDEEEDKKEKEHNLLSKLDSIGLYFLILGFALQILSNFTK